MADLPELTHSIIEFAAKENAKTTKNYLTRDEKKELMQDCGLDGFYLFDHYLSKTHVTNVNLDDGHIGHLIGWTKRKTADVRRKLVQNGYMDTVNYVSRETGQKFTKTILGKVLVGMNAEERVNHAQRSTTVQG